MATFNINIINPVIKLITNVTEESNSCRSVFYFDIQTTPFATLTVGIDNNGREDYISISGRGFVGQRGSRYSVMGENIQAGSTGIVNVRVIIENHTEQTVMGGFDGCNDATVTISDFTNNVLNTQRKFNRCAGFSCDEFPLPEPVDDSYEVAPGSYGILDILTNDKPNTNYGTITPTILTQPSNGTVEVLSDGSVKYTHNGSATTSDSFTYKVTNSLGQESDIIATVTIVISENARSIDNTTKVVALFDDSGSMDGTRGGLEEMRDKNLKELLLPYYGDEATYTQQVTVVNIGSIVETEHFISAVDQQAIDNSILLVFQDEADADYHSGTFSDSSMRPSYESEIQALNTKLNTLNRCNIVVHQVKGFPVFKSFLEAVENGTGVYSGNNGLSGRTNFKVKYDVEANKGGEYYTNLVAEALNELGFNI